MSINLNYLLYLKFDIDKENPKKSYITLALNDIITTNNIVIKYEDLISDELFDSLKLKVFDIKEFEPENLIETIFLTINWFLTDELDEKKLFNVDKRIEGLVEQSKKRKKQHLKDIENEDDI